MIRLGRRGGGWSLGTDASNMPFMKGVGLSSLDVFLLLPIKLCLGFLRPKC